MIASLFAPLALAAMLALPIPMAGAQQAATAPAPVAGKIDTLKRIQETGTILIGVPAGFAGVKEIFQLFCATAVPFAARRNFRDR